MPLIFGGAKALSAKAALGQAMFFDPALSPPGKQSCASRHSAANAYLAPNGFAVPFGGVSGNVVGFRTAPSVAYAALTPPFGFLAFCMLRDNAPRQIDRKADGSADIAYNDLPLAYQANREVRPPFTAVRGGARLTPGEINDVIAFICTLNDGYDPQHPQACPQPLQCRRAARP